MPHLPLLSYDLNGRRIFHFGMLGTQKVGVTSHIIQNGAQRGKHLHISPISVHAASVWAHPFFAAAPFVAASHAPTAFSTYLLAFDQCGDLGKRGLCSAHLGLSFVGEFKIGLRDDGGITVRSCVFWIDDDSFVTVL